MSWFDPILCAPSGPLWLLGGGSSIGTPSTGMAGSAEEACTNRLRGTAMTPGCRC